MLVEFWREMLLHGDGGVLLPGGGVGGKVGIAGPLALLTSSAKLLRDLILPRRLLYPLQLQGVSSLPTFIPIALSFHAVLCCSEVLDACGPPDAVVSGVGLACDVLVFQI